MNEWMHACMHAWMNDWLTDWLTHWLTDSLTHWLNGRMDAWTDEWMNEESCMREQQTCPPTIYFNMWTLSWDVSIQMRHWQPLLVHLWSYCTHQIHDVNDVMCVGWPLHWGLRPLLFSNSGVGSFVPQEPDKCNCCETGRTYGFSSLSEKTRSLTVCRCHYKGSTFFSVI